jgi:hypothetical protein
VPESSPFEMLDWYSFLRASRRTNSRLGGWNSRTHWAKRGLRKFVNDGRPEPFISSWTIASLKTTCDPVPRTKAFKIAEREKDLVAGKRGKTGTPKGENLINWQIARRIFLDHSSGRQRGVTYELPLSARKQGQLKADVVVFNARGLVEIVELKRTGSRGTPDNPLMALVEGICYTLQLLRCWRDLQTELAKSVDMNAPPRTINIVLAAPDYWDRCHGVGKAITSDETGALFTIVKAVDSALPSQDDGSKPSIALTLASVMDDRRCRSPFMPVTSVLPDSIVIPCDPFDLPIASPARWT